MISSPKSLPVLEATQVNQANRIYFFKQQMLFIKQCFTILQQYLKMYGEHKMDGLPQGSYRLFPPQNHFFFVTDTVLPTHSQPWNMPIFYGFRNLQILPPQSTAVLPTSHQIPAPTFHLPRFHRQKRLTGRAHLRQKRRPASIEKELQSASKNSESNIINQFYSFYSSQEASRSIVIKSVRLLNKDKALNGHIKNIFYNIIFSINIRRGRKYVNRENLLRYFNKDFFKSEIPDMEEQLQKIEIVSLVLTAYFIKNVSITAILSSRRIKNLAKSVHLRRRRRILQCIENTTE